MSIRTIFAVKRSLLTVALSVAGLMLLAPTARAQTRHVFVVSAENPPQGKLYEYTSTNDTTWSERVLFTINGHPSQSVSVYSSNIASFAGGGQIWVAYVGLDSQTQLMHQHVMHSADDVNWTDTDVSPIGNPLPDITSGVVGFTDSSGVPRVIYITQPTNGNEYATEVFLNGSTWVNEGTLSVAAAAPGTAVAGYLFNTTSQAFYIGTDGHIHEVYKPSNSGWLATDVTVAANAPLPISGSNLLGYKFNSNAPIHYFTSNGHVHQIWWNGSSWKTDDVTQLAGTAPNCVVGTQNGVKAPLTGYMFNGQPTVNCSAGGLIQMWWTGSKELWNDWTGAAGGSPELYDPIAGYAVGNHNTIFYFDGSSPTVLVYEYLWNGSTTQRIQLQQTFYIPAGLATAVF